MLWDIFTTLFEPQLGIWIGNECNPFKKIDTAPNTLVSRLMVTLDSLRCSTKPDRHVVQLLRLPIETHHSTEDTVGETKVNQALMSAVHAFASRWLPVEYFRQSDASTISPWVAKRSFMETLWRQAHVDVVQVLTRPSYRSILALYLFAITPTSSHNPLHPSSHLCYESSLRQYLQLRLESQISTIHSFPSHTPAALGLHNQVEALLEEHTEFSHLEDSAYCKLSFSHDFPSPTWALNSLSSNVPQGLVLYVIPHGA